VLLGLLYVHFALMLSWTPRKTLHLPLWEGPVAPTGCAAWSVGPPAPPTGNSDDPRSCEVPSGVSAISSGTRTDGHAAPNEYSGTYPAATKYTSRMRLCPQGNSEPPRKSRRLFCFSPATLARYKFNDHDAAGEGPTAYPEG